MVQKNGQMWLDERGNAIQAHGGMILEWEETFYWYGENKGQENVPGTTRVDVIGVSCYSSKNLVDWHYEGLVLKPEEDEKQGLFQRENVCERPKVIYNKKTNKFVMWMHMDTSNYLYAGVGIAVSDSPTGPFALLQEKQPNRQDSRDMTVFEDIDGTAYLIHSANWNKTLNIARMTEDYQDLDGFYVSVLIDQEREAPAIIHEKDRYYMVSSGCTGWGYNSALYATSDHLQGKWKLIDNPCEGPGYRDTFQGQSTFLLRARGRVYLMLDHWLPENLQKSGYSILPVTIEDGKMTVQWEDTFQGLQ